MKMVNKRKFTYIIEVRLNASAAYCLKCRAVLQVWKGALNLKKLGYIFVILALMITIITLGRN